MKTLKQIFFKNQEKFIETGGDEEDIPYWVIENSVKEWLKQKIANDTSHPYLTITDVITDLLEELQMVEGKQSV